MAKIALLIGVSEYSQGIPPLSSALNDVEAMQRVLQDPNLGGFEQVERLLNPDAIAMRKAIQKLFREASKEDLVLFFFSGHGITNDEDHLYLATRNTAKDDFEATAVDASFIRGQSNNCYAKRQVLILDACYSGAIAQGWKTKSIGVDIKKQLGAEGRVVLTSSSATQTSFEQEGSTLSLYTQYLVEGIETGAADTDNDGNIHVQELHAYAKAKVQAVKPKMTPDIILDKEGFNILLAYAPKNPESEYRKLVEQYAQNGELSKLSYLILKPKRKTSGITDEKAEQIENEVLEPLRRRFANLESYKQAFVEVVEQKYPLDEHTRKILKDYQQDILGLRDEDVAPIELEITSAKKAEYRKQVQIQKQQEKEEYENSLQYYEQEFIKAIKAQYPLDEYVRNGLKQFQESLGLNDEDVERIEAPLLTIKRAEYQKQQQAKKQQQEQQSIQTTTKKPTQQNNDLSSEKGIDYTRLRDLLKARKWEEADQETLEVMLKVVDREQKLWLDPESIKNFPSTDLRTIDQLWVKYSDGRFGFSVQKLIWESVAKDYTKLGDRIGWRTYETVIHKKIVEHLEEINQKLGFQEKAVTTMGGKWLYYTDLTFDIHAPEGHLPATVARGEGEHHDFGGGWVCVPSLLSRRDL
ncbi:MULTISPECIES: caspase, EACC1-associated type [unclassified Tolypothrix]|uniref:caspase, EACC1-associated type n=1 Tax=unclassified Tolypothrix TaxID=2649714 RepID=UPI0005EAA854|nr:MULTISPECIES: GUN4 domain-containing protein [unclassified Tolypothrix]BAY94576.1 GUN4 domain-containing protein [Microchaete diplosiphon NIES-3275]EKE99218.1 C14 family peptidase [Tolypothrix sp. PCC 7601]MBE9082012.1 GUN4 domain-containing protein [Tolypothrix sp. LEGE 11397]UYD28278.1 GUN4 domain-containing protein [Tolypothrix sp. PCC 7712]UYD35847.1 GUN4 domain-containing protein [Tolypothrix sp. PCC 7601]